jgi:hypothetical protein
VGPWHAFGGLAGQPFELKLGLRASAVCWRIIAVWNAAASGVPELGVASVVVSRPGDPRPARTGEPHAPVAWPSLVYATVKVAAAVVLAGEGVQVGQEGTGRDSNRRQSLKCPESDTRIGHPALPSSPGS